ncbi:MAG: RnfABCDGE type electron transport complex subunit C, partial [Candidatus Omnitrophica bacterium]|nr:RnfABCDGE type electron transport complex subunit C [Candidatus Omnitrophota bacterium]
LIINGAECEPYLTSDHRLMVERTREILKGVELLAKASNAENVYIAIEENKLGAIFAMERAIEQLTTKVVKLKTKYPQGGEKQLIKAVLNREVPPEKLPLDIGYVVQNVGTAYAVYEAVIEGKPLIERCVTLTGSCLRKRGNFLIRIGSMLSDVVEECCSGFIKRCAKIILGGPMMGITHYSLDIPIIKGITGVVFLSEEETEVSEESPCIKCSKCVDVCPVNLIPADIARAVKKQKKVFLEELNVFDCIECGACSFACPARVPLVQYIKLAKAQMQEK